MFLIIVGDFVGMVGRGTDNTDDVVPMKNLTKNGISPIDLLILHALHGGATPDTASKDLEKYGYLLSRDKVKNRISELIKKGVILEHNITEESKKDDRIKWIVVDPSKLFDNQWYTFIKSQNPLFERRVIPYSEMYGNLVELSKEFGIVTAIDLVQGEGQNYDFILRILTNELTLFEAFIEKLRSLGWVNSVDSKPIHVLEGVGFSKGNLTKVHANYFYDPIKLPDFENYLKRIKQVYRTYDTYIKEEGSSKHKITRKKDEDVSID
jgi:DNA-binding Lrp family transcriptional regulator